MEVLLKKQLVSAGYIERFWDNIAKAGKEKMTRSFLTARLELLENYWSRFSDNHKALIVCDKIETTEYISKDLYSMIVEKYIETKSRIAPYLKTEPARQPEKTGETSNVLRQIQLPKISLPRFSGEQIAWESFRDLFKSLVHDVADMAPVQKLQYLRSSLAGEAADVIANVPLTDDAYAGAWRDLLARYDSKRRLLYVHLREVLECPAATKATPTEIKRLLGIMTQATRSFASLKRPVDQWDDWLVHILVSKLDAQTRLHWETSLADNREFPTFKQLQDFLETRVRALEAANPEALLTRSASASTQRTQKRARVLANTTSTARVKGGKCSLCAEQHNIAYCAKYKALTVAQRAEKVQKSKLCKNCLRAGHQIDACSTIGRCLVCAGKHHTTLHSQSTFTDSLEPKSDGPSETSTTSVHNARVTSLTSRRNSTMLLATALVTIQGDRGHSATVRALLDPGSESDFVSERVVRLVRASQRRVNVSVAGLQGTPTGTSNAKVTVTIGSPVERAFQLETKALVLKSLINLLPARSVPSRSWPHIKGLRLADPDFYMSSKVDVILGADTFGRVLRPGIQEGERGTPTALNTVFGWVLTGSTTPGEDSPSISVHHAQPIDELTAALQRFWEIEEVSSTALPKPEDAWVEQHFRETHSRDSTGRYVVRLPRKQTAEVSLGASRPAALSMLLNSERRLSKQPDLRKRYIDFMVEYLALGHMDLIHNNEIPRDSYYLPHHGVFKTGDRNGKIRVVFNASFRTTTGYSLNDFLLPGPRLQSDLWVILTKWRLLRVGFMADIVKMFRQISVHPDDRHLQRILWRAEASEEVRDYTLSTVTYGTTSAPFLALRTLQQLAQDEQDQFPMGAAAILNHSYVDDILAGGDTLDVAHETKEQLVSLLRAGGFSLSKWASNSLDLCPRLETPVRTLPFGETIGALGIIWSPHTDSLFLKVTSLAEESSAILASSPKELTKRRALAELARLFDPLGWAAPVLIYAKVFLQDLWLQGSRWDEPLSNDLSEAWSQFQSSLQQLNEVKIPRWVNWSPLSSGVELHGFSDASERAYAAAVYLRVAGASDEAETHLLLAKTKVAPVKTQSVPRLELCAAVLLARLLTRVTTELNLIESTLFAWIDAQVVLRWIQSHASRWKPFVAHRVAEIQGLIPRDHWRYVRTSHNPADLATRDIPASELLNQDLWWRGPIWLRQPREFWPPLETIASGDQAEEEQRTKCVLAHTTQAKPEEEVLERFSSLTRLLRVTSFCFRFINRCRKNPCQPGGLTSRELFQSRLRWISLAQRQAFHKEFAALRVGRAISSSSPLRRLRPFLDEQGLLRVGGRIEAALSSYDERHPLILPREGPLTLLFIRHAHHATLHGGPTLMRSYLLRGLWILGAATRVRQVARQCVRCARYKSEVGQQRMGQLPPERVKPARPFASAGVDYAGPIQLRTFKGRGRGTTKGYICLFVCLVTKAVHLEAVTELTTAAFLAAYRRFISRRGHCSLLLSDNGRNFLGADAELRRLFKAASEFHKDVSAYLANDGTKWRFIPPYAPHFGGLWEAGVRSVKHHLRRLLGDRTLTYEELSTLLCQIEACLNSRPLTSLSSDPSDLVALTPGHFLVGEPLTGLPEPAPTDASCNPVNRWHLLSNLRNHFWSRWSREYLHQLQQLTKWQSQRPNLAKGDLVLVVDEILPPAKWPLGRVIGVTTGPDGLVRVAEVRTARSTLSRPIVKLCRLPIDSAEALRQDVQNASSSQQPVHP
ncbi:uncharacterized protein [Linepithema humile]|uniref:uncharacterized protein n=1 Tax=Linepithema humile TaxID=83485 RepID=UPI00351EA533